ncbi:putative RNA methylase [Nocardioides cavernae]|uniref:Putative RNA methylase n=1 Tax=Nocardioides cavernae TaxID=1921566 RepID=A0A7Y9KUH0_9ACTN|nr:hypothetical protein [Nocardioides cavernae]NYE38652.1 putative RNA methylase [Nocardioides cavernae]
MGDVGEAVAVGLADSVGDDVAGDVGGGSASLSAHADTAANRSVPVARKVNPSRFFMVVVLLPLAYGDEARRHPAGGACIV